VNYPSILVGTSVKTTTFQRIQKAAKESNFYVSYVKTTIVNYVVKKKYELCDKKNIVVVNNHRF